MTAKDTALNKSLILTEQRVQAISQRQELDQSEALPTTYQGHDPQTGTSKFSRAVDCEDTPITGGDLITTGAIAIGETVLSRPTEGKTRLDRSPSISNPTECGSGGSPNPRNFGVGGDRLEGRRVPESGFSCPVYGTEQEGSRRVVGLSEQYEVYTGEPKTGVVIGGRPRELWEICETETITIRNSPNARNPANPFAGLNDDGCVKPTDVQAGTLKRCQFYPVDESEINSSDFLPEGMFNSGFVEFPEGVFRVMGCMEEDEPAQVEGAGAEWNPANITETGAAAENTEYCSGSAIAELRWSEGNIETFNPPISYVINDISTGIEVDWGGGDIDILTGTTWEITYTNDWVTEAIYYFALNTTFSVSTGSFIGRFALHEDGVPFTGYSNSGSPDTLTVEFGDGQFSAYWNGNPIASRLTRVAPNESLANEGVILQLFKQIITVTTDTLDTSQRVSEIDPDVSLFSGGYSLVVSDSGGVIAEYTYEIEPTNFVRTCRSNTPVC